MTIAAILILAIAATIVQFSPKKKHDTSDRIVTDAKPSTDVRDINGDVVHANDPTPTTIYKPTDTKDLNSLYDNMKSNDVTTTKTSKDAGTTVASVDDFTSKGGDVTAKPKVEIVSTKVSVKPKPIIKSNDFTEKGGTIDRKGIPNNLPNAYSNEKYLLDGYLVTVGAFANNESVMRQIENLRIKGFDNANFGKFEFAPSLKVVYAGKFDNEKAAQNLVNTLRKKGFKEAAVRKRF